MILDISNELMDTGRSKQYTVSYESDTFSYRDVFQSVSYLMDKYTAGILSWGMQQQLLP